MAKVIRPHQAVLFSGVLLVGGVEGALQRAGPVVAAAFFLFLASLGGACLGCGLSFGLLGLGRFLLGLFLAVLSLRLARRTAAPVGGIASLAPTRQGRWFGTDGRRGASSRAVASMITSESRGLGL